jgi:hypothetical protein
MKNRNAILVAIVFALAFGLPLVTEAAPRPDGGPTSAQPANEQPRPDGGPVSAVASESADSTYSTSPEGENLPVVTIHSTGNILRGKTGSFVLDMKPVVMFGGTYVNFNVSGTAIPGVDYVPLVSPAYIGQSGYGTILVQTLPDPRTSAFRQSYSVVVTLQSGPGYAVGEPNSAQMMIK